MLTKEKIIAAIQAMPETEFEDIDVLLEQIVDLAREERQSEDDNNNILQESSVAYQSLIPNDLKAEEENIPEMIKQIDHKIESSTDLETIYLLKKIKNGLQDSIARNYFTVEEVQAKIDSWFKK